MFLFNRRHLKNSERLKNEKITLKVSFFNLSEFFKCLRLNKNMHDRDCQLLLNYYIDPSLDSANAREFFDTREIGFREFTEMAQFIFQIYESSVATWGCWRVGANSFKFSILHPAHGCCFALYKILDDDRIEAKVKYIDNQHKENSTRYYLAKQWSINLKSKAVLFILSKNSKSMREIWADVLRFCERK
jgi:hypothetical protein